VSATEGSRIDRPELSSEGGAAVDALALAKAAARAADAKQGTETIILPVGDILGITEYFVVTGASNRRLVRAVADDIERSVRDECERSPGRTEGLREQQWVLLDYGDVVVHVFLEETRQFYEIERLYKDVPRVEWRD
jgi:ribosome-associated protein